MIFRQSVPGSAQGLRFFGAEWITRCGFLAVAKAACLRLFLAPRARKRLRSRESPVREAARASPEAVSWPGAAAEGLEFVFDCGRAGRP